MSSFPKSLMTGRFVQEVEPCGRGKSPRAHKAPPLAFLFSCVKLFQWNTHQKGRPARERIKWQKISDRARYVGEICTKAKASTGIT